MISSPCSLSSFINILKTISLLINVNHIVLNEIQKIWISIKKDYSINELKKNTLVVIGEDMNFGRMHNYSVSRS